MPQLLIAAEPGIFVLADAVLDGDQYATDEDFIKINSNSKFAVVRKEFINMGYYRNGDSPPAPVSPVDTATLDGDEIIMLPIYTTTAAADNNFIPGQVSFPNLQPFTHGAPLVLPYQHYWDQDSGAIVDSIYAFDTPGQNSQVFDWGVSLVFAICQRIGIFLQDVVGGATSGSSGGGGGTSGGTGGSSGGGTPGVTSIGIANPDATLSLAPADAGPFQVAHGLGVVPRVIGGIRMTSDGAVWFGAAADSTFVYFVASSGGITGEVDLWL